MGRRSLSLALCAMATSSSSQTGLRFELSCFDSGDEAATQFRGRDVRRMYAILSADVFGYTRLVEQDDLATARQLEGCLKIARDRVERMDGRVFQVAGDEIVALFNSAGSAVQSAVVWQMDIARFNAGLPPARRMEFRVGINSGDLLVTPAGAIIGDAINITARVQNIAPPGGIFISGVVRDQLQGEVDLRFEFVQTDGRTICRAKFASIESNLISRTGDATRPAPRIDAGGSPSRPNIAV